MTAIAYATLAQVKSSLGITGSTHDTVLGEILLEVSEWFDSEVGGSFTTRSIVERHSGDGRTRGIVLSGLPSEDQSDRETLACDEGTTALVYGTDFAFSTDSVFGEIPRVLYRLDGAGNFSSSAVWASGFKNLKFTYNTAFKVTPADVRRACIEESNRAFMARNISDFKGGGRIGLTGHSSDVESSTTFTVDDISPAIMRMLSRYRKRFEAL